MRQKKNKKKGGQQKSTRASEEGPAVEIVGQKGEKEKEDGGEEAGAEAAAEAAVDAAPSSSQSPFFDDGGVFVTAKCFICDRDGVIKCDKYPQVTYCSREHQKLHYPPTDDDDDDDEADAEAEPFPFLVKYRDGVGRYAVAARDLSPGELVFTEDPVAMGPNHNTPPSCPECMKRVDGSYTCPECNLPACDEMCAYGPEHSSKECKIFSKLQEKIKVTSFGDGDHDPRYWSLTVLRVLLLRDQESEKYRAIARMIDHNEEHEKDTETWELYKREIVDFLLDSCGLRQMDFDESEVFHALGAIDVNSVKVNSGANATRAATDEQKNYCAGHALYPLTALLSHSCLSTSKTILRPSDYGCECRTTTAVAAGRELTKQYVSPLEGTHTRRAKLREGWYFECSCARCADPTELGAMTSATACMRCVGNDGYILPADPLDPDSDWFCDTCGFKTSSESVLKLVEYFLSKMSSTPQHRIEEWESLLERGSRLLHPNHHALTLMRVALNTGYVRLTGRAGMAPADVPVEVFLRRKELLDDTHRVVDIVEPGRTRRRGISLFETSTCHLQIGRLLHDSDRFPTSDFQTLCEKESESLKEAMLCLEHSAEDTVEADIYFKAQAALHEAEYMIRLLRQKQELERLEESRKKKEEEEEKRFEEVEEEEGDGEEDQESAKKLVDNFLNSFKD